MKSRLCTKTRYPHSCPDWAAYPAYPVSALLNSVCNAVRQAVRSIFQQCRRNNIIGRGVSRASAIAATIAGESCKGIVTWACCVCVVKRSHERQSVPLSWALPSNQRLCLHSIVYANSRTPVLLTDVTRALVYTNS